MSSSSRVGSRSSAIDIVKGLAITSVICLHTLSAHTLDEIGANFYIWQAVPVFVFLMGRNAALSLERRGRRSVRELYSWDYLASRLDRVYVPFLTAFAATVLLTILTHTARDGVRTIIGGLLLGTLPIDGPGNYFITLVFEFALVFPLVFWGLRRWPVATLLVCLAVDLTFELIARRLGVFKDHPYIYDVCLARFMFLLALGGLLARVSPARLLASRWLWVGALISTAYLGLVSADAAAIPLGGSEWNCASALYTVFIVALGLAGLPARARGWLPRGIGELGRASYHIFLVQIIWFGLRVWAPGSLSVLLANLAVTLAIGVLFFKAMEWMPVPSAGRLLARRYASLSEA